ncbi:CvpA family protein [Desulfosarcina sp. OttesenSCG-928-A07]|nr:CvpA family protein [Desulfosarcina sp. OttesenSCG-928-G17]MDL2329284.1 CvpA family protein [Desulfosarcina sp. OttesenSCG-928-A07]
MNLFDILVVTILAYGLIRGIFRGFVREVAAIIGVLAGFYAAYTYYRYLANAFLSQWIDTPTYQYIVSYLIIFSVVLAAVDLLAMVITYLMKITYTGWVDRISGALFGIFKGTLVICVLFIVLTTFLPKSSTFIREATLSPYVATVSETMISVASDDFRNRFALKIKELKKSWQKN